MRRIAFWGSLPNLRGQGEHYMSLPRLRAHEISPEDMRPEEFLQAAGWEVLNDDDDDHVIFWEAWEKAGSRWVE
jgi:hypothetical protein